MLKIYVNDVLKVNNMISLAGERIESGELSKLSIGNKLSDGINEYEIVGIPFVHYKNIEAMRKNICILIKPGNYNEKELEGKILYLA